jgi:hypothetical protein
LEEKWKGKHGLIPDDVFYDPKFLRNLQGFVLDLLIMSRDVCGIRNNFGMGRWGRCSSEEKIYKKIKK